MRSNVETTNTRVSVYIEGYTDVAEAQKLALRIYRNNIPEWIISPRFMEAAWRYEETNMNAYNLIVDNNNSPLCTQE